VTLHLPFFSREKDLCTWHEMQATSRCEMMHIFERVQYFYSYKYHPGQD